MKTLAWQAIIFDFDGVVVESGEIKTQAFANLYRDYGETVMSEVARYHVLPRGDVALSEISLFPGNPYWESPRLP